MKRKIDQFDLVDLINERTGYYKKDLRVIFEVLEDIIFENMQTATIEEPSEVRLFYGFILGAKKRPVRERRDPRTQEKVKVKETLAPYVKIKPTFITKVKNLL